MKKRCFLAFLSACMLVFTLIGCSGDDAKEKTKSNDGQTESEKSEEDKKNSKDSSEDASDSSEESTEIEIPFVCCEEHLTVNLADGWEIGELSSDTNLKLLQSGTDAYITVALWTNTKNATEWADSQVSNYANKASIQDVEINGRAFKLITPDDVKNQFVAFSDIEEGSIIKYAGMFVSFEDALPQLEALTVK